MSSRDHHSSSSSSRRHPPISGASRSTGTGRRSSVSSGSDRERGVFHMSDSDRSSSRASSHRSARRPSIGGGSSDISGLARDIGNNLSLRDDRSHSSSSRYESSSSSSGSWQPTAPAASGPGPSRFYGGSSSSGSSSSARQPSSGRSGGSSSDPFASRSASNASAMNIPVGTGGRREIINSASQYPGSGHSDHFKSRNEASTGQSYDSWKSDASVRAKYDSIKAGEDSWKGRGESYDRRLDNTPPSRGGRGESYPDINKDLSRSQRELTH